MGEVEAIVYTHVTKRYQKILAVNDLTATVRKGSVTGVVGRNGAGKTTTLKMTMGLLRPTIGKIEVLGEDPYANTRLMRRVGYVPDDPLPWTWLSAKDLIERLLKISGFDYPGERAENALSEVGIKETRPVDTFSRGMKQRVKIAAAIARDPELLIMDEPLNGLDPGWRLKMLDLFTRLSKEGKTILISSNVLFEIDRVCTDILFIERGYAVAYGPREAISKLLMSFPHRVKIITSESRKLAKLMLERKDVSGVKFIEQGVLVETVKPAEFYYDLPRVLLEEKIPVKEIESLDDSIDALYAKLTRRAGGVF